MIAIVCSSGGCKEFPHEAQKLASSGFLWPHRVQYIVERSISRGRVELYHSVRDRNEPRLCEKRQVATRYVLG